MTDRNPTPKEGTMAKQMTQQEWESNIPHGYAEMRDGVPYLLYLSENEGTVWGPVEFTEPRYEVRRIRREYGGIRYQVVDRSYGWSVVEWKDEQDALHSAARLNSKDDETWERGRDEALAARLDEIADAKQEAAERYEERE